MPSCGPAVAEWGSSALSGSSSTVSDDSRSSRTTAANDSSSSPPYKEKYEASHSLARGCVYSPCLSFNLTRRLAPTNAASAAACAGDDT
jgi:hypothetical protein